MDTERFFIITGMSGAGKSNMLRVLEDVGFFCIDNLPPTLIPKFAELYQQMDRRHKNVALVVDIRLGTFFGQLTEVLRSFAKSGFKYDLLFLDCSDEKLIRRYKETRRRHPLATDDRISNGITLERSVLQDIRGLAGYIIDTSDMSANKLRQYIIGKILDDSPGTAFTATLLSFGFKYGLPVDADMVIDVRFLDNPFYVEALRGKNGNEQDVGDYIKKSPAFEEFLAKQGDLLDFLLPQFIKEGRAQLVVAVGCTGGMHRSVFIANALAERLKADGYKVRREDRDIEKAH